MEATPTLSLAMLKSIQFVIGQDGRPTAVQIGIDAWNSLLDWLENNEDRALVKASIPQLRNGPTKIKVMHWKDIRDEWNDPKTGVAE